MGHEDTSHTKSLGVVSGTIVKARGLLNSKLLGKSLPRVYVKGIKGNSHLVNFFSSQCGEGNNPVWDEEWSFNALKCRTRDEFVGLKFLVYDGNDFLGGADFDISELSSYRTMSEELELLGLSFNGGKGIQPKKARLWLCVSVNWMFLPCFERPRKMLLDSMKSFKRVTSICGRIVRARGIIGKQSKEDHKKSLPMCFVRCYMSSGNIVDMYHTKCHESVTDPSWDEMFEFDFEENHRLDQPLVLIFDVFGSAGNSPEQYQAIFEAGDHLGSAMLPVACIGNEEQFSRGEGRHKLLLLGESQLIEKRLEKDAGRGAREKVAVEKKLSEKDHPPLKKSWSETILTRCAEKMKAMSNYKISKAKISSSFHITTELFAESEDVVMPFSELLHEAIVVEESDAKEHDEELIEYFGKSNYAGERVKRLTVTSEERIVSLYGRVNDGVDLIAADLNGKSDPYVIVEALTKGGEMLFVYRTRVIKANLNPKWGESFFWTVPPDPDNPKIPVALSKLHFSIFDSDENQLATLLSVGEEDDFLGGCSVDVSTMRNSDCLLEDIPLLGVKSRPGGYKSQGGFRRFSTVSAEVRVERRVMRIVEIQHDFDPALLDCHRHHESRPMYPPEFRGYRDLSQLEPISDPSALDQQAKTLLSLRDTGRLLEVAKIHQHRVKQQDGQGWLAVREPLPYSVPVAPPLQSAKALHISTDSEEAEIPISFRRDWKTLWEDWDDKLHNAQADRRNLDYVSRLAPMPRCGSLPMLSTRFGENYEMFIHDPFEEQAKREGKFLPPHFVSGSGKGDTVLNGIKSKPPREQYTTRQTAQ